MSENRLEVIQNAVLTILSNPNEAGTTSNQAHDEMQKIFRDHNVTNEEIHEIIANNISKLPTKIVAGLFIWDLLEDDVEITKEKLSDIVNNPAKPEYKLEADMIKRVSHMSDLEKANLIESVSLELGFNGEEKTVGSSIKATIKEFWKKTYPALDHAFDTIVEIGAKALNVVIDINVANPILKSAAKSVVNDTADALKDANVLDPDTGALTELIGEAMDGSIFTSDTATA